MRSELDNGKLTIWLEGRIDTGNASEIEKAGTAMQIADVLMNKLLRPIVVPNEQAVKQLFQVL